MNLIVLRRSACICASGWLLGIAASAAKATSAAPPPGPVLGAALNYRLIGTPQATLSSPVPNPGVDVSLNPQPLPPFPDPNASLDLTDPESPVYTNFDKSLNFEIDFGLNLGGGAASFVIPKPGDPGNFSFSASTPGGPVYDVAFQIVGPGPVDPGTFVTLNPQPLPPFPDPGYSFAAFDFNFGGAVDPLLTFQVSVDGTPFGFAQAPEPSVLAALLIFGGSALLKRRMKAQCPA